LKEKENRNNLIGCLIVFSYAAFTQYMVNLYTKYIPGSILFNTVMLGSADMVASVAMVLIHKKFSTPFTLKVLFACSMVCSMIFHLTIERQQMFENYVFVGCMVFVLRLFVKSIFGMAHYCCVELFPILLRAKAFSITNTTARTF
jgi:hypothetical protein